VSVLRLVAFVLPLGLDTFAVAAALGAAGSLTGRDRLRVSVLFVVFEGGMPLIGLAAGAPLARTIGPVADYLAVAALIGLGAWMVLAGRDGEDAEEEKRAVRLKMTHGVAILALGVSISLDELAIGFTLGLARLPLLAVIVAIAVQTLVAVQLGLYLGVRIGERIREGAERLAGVALIALGGYVLAEHLLSR
jgi:putative Mn2+ efflux pump MntP